MLDKIIKFTIIIGAALGLAAFIMHFTRKTKCIEKYKQSVPIPILIGGYGATGGVKTLKNKDFFSSDVVNTSWMLRVKNNNIIINNEWGPWPANGKLYLMDEVQDGKEVRSYEMEEGGSKEKRLAGPVYFCLWKGTVYIACYGNPAGDAGGILTCSESLKEIKSVVCPVGGQSRIHCIDQFQPLNGNSFLIAVGFGAACLYKIDKGGVNFNTILYSFEKGVKPRHFIQIPNTNKIVVIIEGPDPKLVLLLYEDGNFEEVDLYDLTNLAPTSPSITGAAIKYHGEHIYCTIRTYKSVEGADDVAANGIFAKFTLEEDKLVKKAQVGVGKNPRYFAINKKDIAYIANQESMNVMQVYIKTMTQSEVSEVSEVTEMDNEPAFILL